MSGELFGRIAKLKVGPSAKGQSTSLASLNPRIYQDFRIAFDIGKTSESAPNTSKITIYNLSAATRSELEQADLRVELEVGYAGLGGGEPLLSQIFIGDIPKNGVHSERRGPDIITLIEAGDSETTLREATIDETFAPGTSSDVVIKALAGGLDVAIGTVMAGLPTVFQNGLALSGRVSDNLDILTKQTGLEWSVQDGELNILLPASPTPEQAVLVSPETGLVGIPSRKADGYEFQSLINPLIKPGRAISLVSKTISGLVKARRCVYQGDTHADKWIVTVEAV